MIFNKAFHHFVKTRTFWHVIWYNIALHHVSRFLYFIGANILNNIFIWINLIKPLKQSVIRFMFKIFSILENIQNIHFTCILYIILHQKEIKENKRQIFRIIFSRFYGMNKNCINLFFPTNCFHILRTKIHRLGNFFSKLKKKKNRWKT